MDRNSNSKDTNGGYGRVVKYLGLFGGAQGFSVLMNLLRNKVTSELLGTVGVGLLGLYNRTVQMFSDCTNLSLSYSAVRKLSDIYGNGSREELLHYVKVTRSVALLTGIVGMLLFMLFSPPVMRLLSGSEEFSPFYFVAISPVVLFMAVSGGEVAVLRGARRLNSLAVYTLWSSLSALLVAVPVYYFMGTDGILPSLFVISLLQMAGVLYHTLGLYPYRATPFSKRILRDGVEMLKLGAGYIYATVLVSCSAWLIYSAISAIGGESELGLFSAGFLLMSMLPTVLFAAMDSEYYPRLAASFGNAQVRNAMVNEQVEVHSLVQAPVILAVVLLLPLLMPLLYSGEFMPAVAMAQIAVFSLLFHVLTYPVSFMTLSKGDIVLYMLQETVYNVANVLLVVSGYMHYGLFGAGMGILLTRVLDFGVVYAIAFWRYGFRLSAGAVKYIFMNGTLALLVAGSVFFLGGAMSWLCGVSAVLCSAAVSAYILLRHGKILNRIIERLKLKK